MYLCWQTRLLSHRQWGSVPGCTFSQSLKVSKGSELLSVQCRGKPPGGYLYLPSGGSFHPPSHHFARQREKSGVRRDPCWGRGSFTGRENEWKRGWGRHLFGYTFSAALEHTTPCFKNKINLTLAELSFFFFNFIPASQTIIWQLPELLEKVAVAEQTSENRRGAEVPSQSCKTDWIGITTPHIDNFRESLGNTVSHPHALPGGWMLDGDSSYLNHRKFCRFKMKNVIFPEEGDSSNYRSVAGIKLTLPMTGENLSDNYWLIAGARASPIVWITPAMWWLPLRIQFHELMEICSSGPQLPGQVLVYLHWIHCLWRSGERWWKNMVCHFTKMMMENMTRRRPNGAAVDDKWDGAMGGGYGWWWKAENRSFVDECCDQ